MTKMAVIELPDATERRFALFDYEAGDLRRNGRGEVIRLETRDEALAACGAISVAEELTPAVRAVQIEMFNVAALLDTVLGAKSPEEFDRDLRRTQREVAALARRVRSVLDRTEILTGVGREN